MVSRMAASLEAPMTETRSRHDALDTRAHRLLERLTTAKLVVGLLRRSLRQDMVMPATAEEHLAHIEQEIDAAAALVRENGPVGVKRESYVTTSR
jgi:hypothetical protein